MQNVSNNMNNWKKYKKSQKRLKRQIEIKKLKNSYTSLICASNGQKRFLLRKNGVI